MNTRKILKILNYGVIAAVIVTTLSFFLPIVLCTKSPVIQDPEYKLGFCKLPNPFAEQLVGISEKFYGISAEPAAGLIIQFLLTFIIISIILFLFRKKTQRILDLTKEKQK